MIVTVNVNDSFCSFYFNHACWHECSLEQRPVFPKYEYLILINEFRESLVKTPASLILIIAFKQQRQAQMVLVQIKVKRKKR